MFVVCFNCFLKDHLNTVMAEEDVFPPPKDRVSLSRSSFLILLFRQGKRKMCQDNNNTLKKALRFTNSLCCFLMSSKYVFETKIQTRHEDYRVSQQVLNMLNVKRSEAQKSLRAKRATFTKYWPNKKGVNFEFWPDKKGWILTQ